MLFLILPHRHMGRAIEQDVGGHQHRIIVQANARALAVLARLVLELGHAVEPADARDIVEQPGQLAVRGHARLVEQDRSRGIDAAGDDRGGHFETVVGDAARIDRIGQRVQIGDEIHALAARRLDIRLHADPLLDRAKIVAEVQIAGGLDAGNDAHGKGPGLQVDLRRTSDRMSLGRNAPVAKQAAA